VAKESWAELSPRTRSLISVAAVGELTLKTAALIDIRRRSRDQVRGPRLMWAALCFVNLLGPLSYFIFGRREH
jgi:Phospholipase_D-nuclease N-terminal